MWRRRLLVVGLIVRECTAVRFALREPKHEASDLEWVRTTIARCLGTQQNHTCKELNKVAHRDYPPLRVACEHGFLPEVRELLSMGADLHVRLPSDNGQVIHYASAQGQLDVVKLLIEEGADVTSLTSAGCTPLHYAAAAAVAHPKQQAAVARTLIAEGVDIDARTEDGLTALYTAATILAADVIQVLLEAGADTSLSATNADGGGPIHLVVDEKDASLTKLLLDAGADPNAVDDFGTVPLHIAVWKGWAGGVRILAEAGGDVNARSDANDTPLHVAAFRGSTNTVRQLLRSGADVDAGPITPFGLTCSLTALRRGDIRTTKQNVAAAKLLIKAGATKRLANMERSLQLRGGP